MKDVAYDNVKSRKKAGFHPLSRKNYFGITTAGVKLTPSLFRVKHQRINFTKTED